MSFSERQPLAVASTVRSARLPALVVGSGERASKRFLEFFTAQIRNPHTRWAYGRAVADFLAFCTDTGVPSLQAVEPFHVAAYVELVSRERSAPTAKQHLAAIRHLFDWFVVGQILPVNPAASVRGPTHVVSRGKTPVLAPDEARRLLDSIDVSTHAGLRDRALIGLMVYSFARIGATLGMRVEDVYVQHRRLWVRLHEKGGKRHEMPCHHSLEAYLHGYLDGPVANFVSGPRNGRGGVVFRLGSLRKVRPRPGPFTAIAKLCDRPARAAGRERSPRAWLFRPLAQSGVRPESSARHRASCELPWHSPGRNPIRHRICLSRRSARRRPGTRWQAWRLGWC